jgi:hypothetical protein
MYKISDCRHLASGTGPLANIADENERRSITNSSELLYKIVSKYFFSERYLRYDPVVENMRVSQIAIQKATGQMKKIKEAMENEIHTFLETGEISLGFKDMRLYDMVKMIQEQTADQTTVIVGLNKKIVGIEKKVNEQRNQILAIQHLLEVQMEQRNAEIRGAQEAQEFQEAQEAQEYENAKKEERLAKEMVEMYDALLCVFLPVITVIISMIIFIICQDSRSSLYFPENRTLIMDRSS